MQFDWLRCFLKVVECGSMNKAAKALFCSQPSVSNAIKAIEQELGAPVLYRASDGVVPTPLGRMVLQDANLMLGYLESWKQMASSEKEMQPISLLLTGTAPRYFLINCILQMRQENAKWDVKLKYSSKMYGQMPFAGDGGFRFGISYKIPAHILETKQFAEEHGMRLATLQRDEFWLFCNAKNPLAQMERSVVLNDIRGREVLLYQDPMKFPYIDKLLEAGCRFGAQMWHEENLMLALALDEQAVSLRPKNTASHNVYVDNGLLRLCPISDCSMPANLCLFYPNQERITVPEQMFLNRFKTFFPEFEVLS